MTAKGVLGCHSGLAASRSRCTTSSEGSYQLLEWTCHFELHVIDTNEQELTSIPTTIGRMASACVESAPYSEEEELAIIHLR